MILFLWKPKARYLNLFKTVLFSNFVLIWGDGKINVHHNLLVRIYIAFFAVFITCPGADDVDVVLFVQYIYKLNRSQNLSRFDPWPKSPPIVHHDQHPHKDRIDAMPCPPCAQALGRSSLVMPPRANTGQ